MLAFAERQFQLAQRGEDGVSLGEKLEHVARSTGKVPAMLAEQPELPSAGEHLWAWFCELSEGRSGNGFGPNPLFWSEIQAWCEVTGRTLRAWEIRILRRMDVLFLRQHAEATK